MLHLSSIVALLCAFLQITPPTKVNSVSFIETDGILSHVYLSGVGMATAPFSTEDSVDKLLEAIGPQILETEYTDDKGRTQRVRTPCATYSNVDSCARDHAKAVAALETVFPPAPKKEG